MIRDTALAACLIAAACLTVVASFPQSVGYLAVVGVTAVIVARAIHVNNGMLPVRVHPAIALPLVVLWLVFVAAALVHPSLDALMRAPVFIVFSAAFVFVVPAAFPIEAFGRASAYVGAIATLLTVPEVVAGRVLFGFVELSRGYIVPTAGFNTQNHLALLTLFGTLVGAAVLWRTYSLPSSSSPPSFASPRSDLTRRYDHWLAIAVVLCASGLVLTRGRAALGTLALAVVLVGAYRLGNWRGFAITALAVTGAAATGVLAAVFAPDLIAATGVSLTNRIGIWSATVQAIAARPLLGWGFVDPVPVLSSISPTVSHSFHNSYLRMFFVGGFVGGVAYLLFLAGVLWCAVATLRATGPREYALSCAVIPVAAMLFIHVFGGETIFGLSLTSVLSAVFVGYAQPMTAQRAFRTPAAVRQWTKRRRARSSVLDD